MHSHVPSLLPNINVVFRGGKDPIRLIDNRCRCLREVRGRRCRGNNGMWCANEVEGEGGRRGGVSERGSGFRGRGGIETKELPLPPSWPR